jgi:hypothetical protein
VTLWEELGTEITFDHLIDLTEEAERMLEACLGRKG